MQEITQTDTSSENNEQNVKPPRRGLVSLLALTALIIAIISLATQFLFWQQHQKNLDRFAVQAYQVQSAIQPQLQHLNSGLLKQQKEINILLGRTQEAEKKSTILLAKEAEFFLTLAQYNLLYDNNIDYGIKLLSEAAQKLEQVNDPTLAVVNKSLAQALNQVVNTPKIDVADLLSRIASISDQVTGLSTLPVIPTAANTTTKQKPIQLTFKQKMMEVLHSLRGLITIRRLQEPVKPLPSPEQSLYIIQDIQLQLAKAEWGIIHQNKAVYQQGLETAMKQLQTYYLRNPQGAELVRKIYELYQINITPQMPNLEDVINPLRAYIKTSEQTIDTAPNTFQNAPGALPGAPGMSPQAPAPVNTAGSSATSNSLRALPV